MRRNPDGGGGILIADECWHLAALVLAEEISSIDRMESLRKTEVTIIHRAILARQEKNSLRFKYFTSSYPCLSECF